MCSSSPPAPAAPDTSAQTEASLKIAQMSADAYQKQLDWAKQQDSMNRDTLNQVLAVQLPAAQNQATWAKTDRARYESQFVPLENQYVATASNYDNAQRRDQQRGTAIADVNASFDAARRNSLSRLESYGVDPSQTRNAALDIGVRTQQAAAQAGAATAATRNVQDKGLALQADVANFGRGLPSQAAQSYGQAVAAGSAGVSGSNQTTATSTGALTSPLGYSSGALAGVNQSANIVNSGYNNSLNAWQASANQTNAQNSSTASGIGAIAGLAMMMADGGPTPKRRGAITFDNDTGQPMFESAPGQINYGPGDGSGVDDEVPIKASRGEYIIPADVVRKKGEEFFDKLVDRYHTPAVVQEAAHAARVRTGRALNPLP